MFGIGAIIGYAFGTFFGTLERLIRQFWRLPWFVKFPLIVGVFWITRDLWIPYAREARDLVKDLNETR